MGQSIDRLRGLGRAGLAACLVLFGPTASAQGGTAAALARMHAALRPQLESSPLGVPILVSSSESGSEGDSKTRGEVHALLAQPFDVLAARLVVARDWCGMMTLHLNIKACTHERIDGHDRLSLYGGRKGVELAGEPQPVRFGFRILGRPPDLVDVALDAPTGPLGTSDYRITLSAIPVAQGSFVRFTYTYRSSTLSRMAVSTYLATLGRDKVGFSVVGSQPNGQPEHVRGQRGIVERNAVRYYFAIQGWMEALAWPPAQRLEQALVRWFELTERFPLQLHELERGEYLQSKRHDFAEQARRQQALDTAAAGRDTVPVLKPLPSPGQ